MAVGYVNAYLSTVYLNCALATEILCDSNRSLSESIVCLGRPADIGVNAKRRVGELPLCTHPP